MEVTSVIYVNLELVWQGPHIIKWYRMLFSLRIIHCVMLLDAKPAVGRNRSAPQVKVRGFPNIYCLSSHPSLSFWKLQLSKSYLLYLHRGILNFSVELHTLSINAASFICPLWHVFFSFFAGISCMLIPGYKTTHRDYEKVYLKATRGNHNNHISNTSYTALYNTYWVSILRDIHAISCIVKQQILQNTARLAEFSCSQISSW